MKTIQNIAMIATAAVAMMTANVNNSLAATAPEPSHVTTIANEPRVMQYYHVNNDNETRRFEYTVDSEGRVTKKVMYGWNDEDADWMPICQYHVTYGDNTHVMTFGTWDAKNHSFTAHKLSTSYDANKYPSMFSLPDGAF